MLVNNHSLHTVSAAPAHPEKHQPPLTQQMLLWLMAVHSKRSSCCRGIRCWPPGPCRLDSRLLPQLSLCKWCLNFAVGLAAAAASVACGGPALLLQRLADGLDALPAGANHSRQGTHAVEGLARVQYSQQHNCSMYQPMQCHKPCASGWPIIQTLPCLHTLSIRVMMRD